MARIQASFTPLVLKQIRDADVSAFSQPVKLNALSSAEMSEPDSQAGPRFKPVHWGPRRLEGGWGPRRKPPQSEVLTPEVAAGRRPGLPWAQTLPFWLTLPWFLPTGLY